MKESDFQTNIIRRLKGKGIMAKKVEWPGHPDLLVLKDGKGFFIEVKKDSAKYGLRPHQQEIMKALKRKYGMRSITVDGQEREQAWWLIDYMTQEVFGIPFIESMGAS